MSSVPVVPQTVSKDSHRRLQEQHGRLNAKNPYVGYFKHAPRGYEAFADRVLDGQHTPQAEVIRAKALRRNVFVGTFHIAPGKYTDLHARFLPRRALRGGHHHHHPGSPSSSSQAVVVTVGGGRKLASPFMNTGGANVINPAAAAAAAAASGPSSGTASSSVTPTLSGTVASSTTTTPPTPLRLQRLQGGGLTSIITASNSHQHHHHYHHSINTIGGGSHQHHQPLLVGFTSPLRAVKTEGGDIYSLVDDGSNHLLRTPQSNSSFSRSSLEPQQLMQEQEEGDSALGLYMTQSPAAATVTPKITAPRSSPSSSFSSSTTGSSSIPSAAPSSELNAKKNTYNTTNSNVTQKLISPQHTFTTIGRGKVLLGISSPSSLANTNVSSTTTPPPLVPPNIPLVSLVSRSASSQPPLPLDARIIGGSSTTAAPISGSTNTRNNAISTVVSTHEISPDQLPLSFASLMMLHRTGSFGPQSTFPVLSPPTSPASEFRQHLHHQQQPEQEQQRVEASSSTNEHPMLAMGLMPPPPAAATTFFSTSTSSSSHAPRVSPSPPLRSSPSSSPTLEPLRAVVTIGRNKSQGIPSLNIGSTSNRSALLSSDNNSAAPYSNGPIDENGTIISSSSSSTPLSSSLSSATTTNGIKAEDSDRNFPSIDLHNNTHNNGSGSGIDGQIGIASTLQYPSGNGLAINTGLFSTTEFTLSSSSSFAPQQHFTQLPTTLSTTTATSPIIDFSPVFLEDEYGLSSSSSSSKFASGENAPFTFASSWRAAVAARAAAAAAAGGKVTGRSLGSRTRSGTGNGASALRRTNSSSSQRDFLGSVVAPPVVLAEPLAASSVIGRNNIITHGTGFGVSSTAHISSTATSFHPTLFATELETLTPRRVRKRRKDKRNGVVEDTEDDMENEEGDDNDEDYTGESGREDEDDDEEEADDDEDEDEEVDEVDDVGTALEMKRTKPSSNKHQQQQLQQAQTQVRPPTRSLVPAPLLLPSSVGARNAAVTDDYDLGKLLGEGGYAQVRVAERKPYRPVTSSSSSSSSSAAAATMGMGDVPIALDGRTILPDIVAIKCIRKRYLVSEEERDSVVREIEIHRGLERHARIVSLLDVYEQAAEAPSASTTTTTTTTTASSSTTSTSSVPQSSTSTSSSSFMSQKVGPGRFTTNNSNNSASSVLARGGGTPSFVFVVLEHEPGGNLTEFIRAKCVRAFSEWQAKLIIDQLLEALEHLHTKGILHGDIKPSNVLVIESSLLQEALAAKSSSSNNSNNSSNNTNSKTAAAYSSAGTSTSGAPVHSFIDAIKLCDFGNARRSRDARYYALTGDVSLVPWSAISGTMGYFAPEIMSRRPYGTPADIWSTGIMLYELLAGYAPFVPYASCLTEPPSFDQAPWVVVVPPATGGGSGNSSGSGIGMGGGGVSAEAISLCRAMLATDPHKRITASAARAHPWFSKNL